jgi:3-isopropylmalate dehydrogenase
MAQARAQGLGGSLNAGAGYAMGQAAHGSAPDIAGQNIATPLSLILSAGMLLRWHGQRKGLPASMQASAAIEQVTAAAVQAHEVTRDVGGTLGTRETGAAFVKHLLAK